MGKKPDITLVNAAVADEMVMPPLGLLYLASVLEEKNFRFDLRDYQLNEYESQLEIESFLSFLDGSAEIIGISCMNNLLPFVLKSIRALKERDSHKTIILGGPGPTSFAEKIMARFNCVDIICIGEGEYTLPQLLYNLKNHQNLEGIPGLLYRCNGKVVRTQAQQRIRDLDRLPLPAYHLIDLGRYVGDIPIITSRGCPYNCAFCEGSSISKRRYFSRSIENIMSELQLLVGKFKRTSIGFVDDIFILDREKVINLCKEIGRAKLEFRWNCLCRINLIDSELVKIMKEAGAAGLYFGIESGSNKILEKISKRFTIEKVIESIMQTKEYIPSIIASFIWGFPYETRDDFLQTLLTHGYFCKEEIASQLHLLAPMAHSTLYKQFGDTLEFSDDLISDIVLTKYGIKSFRDYILEYPEIHLSFWHYRSEDLDQKVNILKKMKISHFGQRFEKTIPITNEK